MFHTRESLPTCYKKTSRLPRTQTRRLKWGALADHIFGTFNHILIRCSMSRSTMRRATGFKVPHAESCRSA